MDLPLEFEQKLAQYRTEIQRANTEPSRAFLFLELVRQTFGSINTDYAERLLPELESSVRMKQATVVIYGRIDALLNNLIIEFKNHLDPDSLHDAQEQLKKYVAALYSENKREYLALAGDGVRFIIYLPSAPLGGTITPLKVQLSEVDSIDLVKVKPKEAYLWLDRYLMAEKLRSPYTDGFVSEFGTSYFRTYVLPCLQSLWQQHKASYQGLYREWADYLSIVYGTRVESEELFLRHTYLATLAKLMAYQLFSAGTSPSPSLTLDILNGNVFKKWGISNFIEEDFFSWLGRHEQGVEIARSLVQRLARFNMARMDEDVLKGIYQNLVDPEERHDLGEYYTPEWIAQYMIGRLIKDDPRKSVLDPACGSGTFLAATIRYKLQHVPLSGDDLLRHILKTVVGIDIHPLAVTIAKTNYLLALRPVLKSRLGSVSIPIYMANSLQPPAQQTEIMGVKAYEKIVDEETSLHVPALDDPETIDEMVDAVRYYGAALARDPDRNHDILNYLKAGARIGQLIETGQLASDVVSILENTGQSLAKLIKNPQQGDTIWAFVLKNFYKPAFLLHSFNVVIGNPPWLSYRYVDNPDYQVVLKRLITEHYALTSKAELVTQMELATLFFLASAENYLSDGGDIGFVMPRAVFTADQHDAFRKGTYKHLRLGLWHVDDLYEVEPIFKEKGGTVPACLIFANKQSETSYPVPGHKLKGKLRGRNLTLELISDNLTFTDAQFSLITRGERSFLTSEAPHITLREGRSYYYQYFTQGAAIVPRQFWFIDTWVHPDLGLDPSMPFVSTSARAAERAKTDYKGIELQGNIEAQFLYATLTSSEILPFAHLPFLPVILPLRCEQGAFVLCDQAWAQCEGFHGLAVWLKEAEQIWRERRGAKADEMDIYEWLDRMHKLTGQNPQAAFKVLYVASGTHLAACIVNCRAGLDMTVNEIGIPRQGFVADTTTYYFETSDADEAYYLLALLNSELIDKLVKPMQSRGLWGERHFHKKPLEFPIPKYDPVVPGHLRLVELAKQCRVKAQAMIEGSSLPSNLGRARQTIREALNAKLREIDEIVLEVMRA